MPTEQTPGLLHQLKAAKRLPSPPGTAVRVLELCRQDDATIQSIADSIMSDPALSGRLLKYANSSIVGAGREVTSVREAVLLLGLRTVKVTALGFSLASPDFKPRCPEFDLEQFWSESFVTAVGARRIAGQYIRSDKEEAFTAGLLSQIGRLALAHGVPDEYRAVLQRVKNGACVAEAEREVLGIDHPHFGAALLADWKIPDVLVQAVGQQQKALQDGSLSGPAIDQAVCLAVQLMPVFGNKDRILPQASKKARTVIGECLKLDEAAWQQLAGDIQGDYRQAAEMFDMGVAEEVNIFDLYAEAQEEAAKVGMEAQRDHAETLEENKKLLQRATTDALTGVANRAYLDEQLGRMIDGLNRGHGDFAVLMFDIDHFKKFNDTHGHEIGDLVLKHVARTVRAALRETDFLARYGGEEFVILAPCTDRRGACVAAVRACKAVERMCIDTGCQKLRVTISAGLAVTSDYKVVPTAEKLIADADKQLYLSKDAGRNTWSYLGRTASKLPTPVGRV